jgi:predicted permease
LNSLIQLFAENLLPILIVALIGFSIQRILQINPRPLSQIIFNVFTPSLIFTLLINNDIQSTNIGRMVLLSLLTTFGIGLIAWLLSKGLRLQGSIASALILTTIGMNAGNFGLSVNYFAFGDEALAWASIFFITNSLLVNSVGVYIATVGQISPSRALKGLLKVPAIYAIPLAFIVRGLHIELPLVIWRPVELMSSAAIPCMLVALGMQIGNSGLPKRWGLLSITTILRLILSPAIALILANLLKLSGAAYQAGITEAAVPTAVMTSIIALEFDTEPTFVTSAVLITTLLSPITLTPLLAFLGA